MKKTIDVVAAVIRRHGMLFLASRPENKPPCGWEFPGGKIEPGETPALALKRELLEELGVTSVVTDPVYELTVDKGEKQIHLLFLRTFVPEDAPFSGREGQEFGWFPLSGEPPAELLSPDRPAWDFLTNFRSSIQ